MQQVEKEIAERKFETAVCFGKNGKAKYAQVGNEDSIIFTKIQLLQMKGADVTHNHPLGTPPSPEDLYLMKSYKAKSFSHDWKRWDICANIFRRSRKSTFF